MTDSFVQVAPDSTGKKIDNTQLTQTGGSVVQRQRISLGDNANVNNFANVDSAGNLAIKEFAAVTETDASQTVTTSAVTAIAAGLATTWVNMMNVSANGNQLGYTFDGTTPVIGAAGTFILNPYGSVQYHSRIPTAALKIIGSAASTVATIKYA